MTKKTVEDDVELNVSNETEAPDMSADFITHDFHREDLNDLRDKVNEHEKLLKA